MARDVTIYDSRPPVFTYDAKLISPGVNLTLTGVGTPNLKASYGDYGGVGEAVSIKANCEVSISYRDINWIINPDNSITVTGKISGAILKRTKTNNTSTNKQLITADFNGKQTFQATVNTNSSGTYDLNIPDEFAVTIAPGSQSVYPAAIHFKNHNTGTSRPPDEFALGVLITNPNPPLYRPGKVLDSSNVAQSHNRATGRADIFAGNTWSFSTMGTIDGPDGTGNPPYIYHQDDKHNMRKIGNNA